MTTPTDFRANRNPSLRQRFQGLVRQHLWRMDIANHCWIAPSALIDRTWPKGIHIESGCWIGNDVVILAHDMTRGLYLDTRIEKNCVIGARAIIFPGVTVGANSRVLPGAVVTRDVSAGAIVGGNPAAIVEVTEG